jgi:hypothetical protein
MDKLVFVYAAAIIFYFIIPFLITVVKNYYWRKARRSILQLSSAKQLSYSDIRKEKKGVFYLYGVIDAVEKKILWITAGNVTVKVDIGREYLFFIPELRGNITDTSQAARIRLVTPFPLQAGTGVFVSGEIDYSSGFPEFRSGKRLRNNIFFYTGDFKNLLQDALISCRNSYSVPRFFNIYSLIVGTVFGFLFFYIFRSELRFSVQFYIAGSVALFPFALYIPPGVLLIYIADRFLKKLRQENIKKDLLFFQEGKKRRLSAKNDFIFVLAIFLIAAGLILNSFAIYSVLLLLF